jgi:nitrate reductase assembly molybdenum cofactor insertion protein NarJ
VQDRSGALVYANDAGAQLSGFACAQEMLTLDLETLRAHYLDLFEMKMDYLPFLR